MIAVAIIGSLILLVLMFSLLASLVKLNTSLKALRDQLTESLKLLPEGVKVEKVDWEYTRTSNLDLTPQQFIDAEIEYRKKLYYTPIEKVEPRYATIRADQVRVGDVITISLQRASEILPKVVDAEVMQVLKNTLGVGIRIKSYTPMFFTNAHQFQLRIK